MSFTLRIRNAPTLARYWWAQYSAGTVYSGWLDKTEVWNCPYGAYGKTDLRILVASQNYNIMIDQPGLGPIHDDKDYAFDCSTGSLIDITPPLPPSPVEEPPIITTISPSPCYLGAILTINGSKFAPSPSYNAVYFQKGILLVSRVPSSASETQLIVDLSLSTTLSDPTNAGIWQVWVERLTDNKSSNKVSLELKPAIATLYGSVYDSKGIPIATATVTLNTKYTTGTTSAGTFTLSNIDPGSYTVKCTKAGYQGFTKSLTLKEGDNTIDIKMLALGEEPPWYEKALDWLKGNWYYVAGGATAVGIGIALVKRKKG